MKKKTQKKTCPCKNNHGRCFMDKYRADIKKIFQIDKQQKKD